MGRREQFTAAACETAFQSLDGISTVVCSRTIEANGTTIYSVEIEAFPDTPIQNNVFSHDGSPGLGYFACDYSGVTGTNVSCSVTLARSTAVKGTLSTR